MVLGWGLGLTTAAFLMHLALWRIYLPRRQTRTLLVIFSGIWIGAGILLWRSVFPESWIPTWPEYLQAGMMVASLALAYIITYSAWEAESPSLVMVRLIKNAGPEGLPREKLLELASDEILIDPRLQDLALNHQCRLEEGRYILTAKGIGMLRLVMFWRWLLGTGKGG